MVALSRPSWAATLVAVALTHLVTGIAAGLESLTWSQLWLKFDPETLIQIGLAIVCGGLLGLERELRGRAAGVRTMMLMCLGSTMVMIVSADISSAHGVTMDAAITRVDPARIAAGIVTGVGFLGAALVIRLGDIVRGVTTAASIWYAATLGVVIGHGSYLLALVGTAAGLFVLWLMHYVERTLSTPVYRLLEVEFSPVASGEFARCVSRTDAVAGVLRERSISVMDVKSDIDVASGAYAAVFHIRAAQRYQAPGIVVDIAALDGVTHVSWK